MTELRNPKKYISEKSQALAAMFVSDKISLVKQDHSE